MLRNTQFQPLSSKEEKKLNKEELLEYYKKLREYALNRKLTNTTPGATTMAPKLKEPTNQVATFVTKLFSDANVEWLCDGQENIPEGPVIFAHTHQGILDGFVWIPKIDRHCLILHGADVNKLLLLCQINTGLVLVRKADPEKDSIEIVKEVKEYNHNAKLDMIKLLLENHSISYFPETTWNLSPNKIHLPLHYGFLDTARKANCPVVPVVHEYTYISNEKKEKISRIHTRFGKTIYITAEDDILEKLEEYKEIISTIRWDLINEKGLFERSSISNWEYINFLKGNYKNLRFGKLDLDKERKNIYTAQDEFYTFHHINDVPFDDEGNLLETEEVRKLKILNKKHNI